MYEAEWCYSGGVDASCGLEDIVFELSDSRDLIDDIVTSSFATGMLPL